MIKGQAVPQALRGQAREYFEDLERRGVIRRSRSEWRNPIRAIQKPSGGIRVVSNLIALNTLVEKDPMELRNIRDVVRATAGSKIFSVIDLEEAFYHIELEEEDKHKIAFEFDGVLYKWNSMVMCFKNPPQVLQRVINENFEDLRGKGVDAYMDYIIIYGESRE